MYDWTESSNRVVFQLLGKVWAGRNNPDTWPLWLSVTLPKPKPKPCETKVYFFYRTSTSLSMPFLSRQLKPKFSKFHLPLLLKITQKCSQSSPLLKWWWNPPWLVAPQVLAKTKGQNVWGGQTAIYLWLTRTGRSYKQNNNPKNILHLNVEIREPNGETIF